MCVIGKEITFADMEPDERVLAQFKARGDNQIASLEMLAIAMGMSLFTFSALSVVGAFENLVQDSQPSQSSCGDATW